MTSTTTAAASTSQERPLRVRVEIIIVLGLSLGQSAIFGIWWLIKRAMDTAPIGQQSTTIIRSASDVPWMDFAYQLLSVGFRVFPALLAVYLLASSHGSALRRLGLFWRGEGSSPVWRDLARGAGLAAVIGLPGLLWVGIGRALGWTVKIDTSGLPSAWWAATVLLLGALATGILEETVAVGYLVTRLQDARWGAPAAIAASALLRALYHAYQGPGMMIGNAVMGALFAWYFARTRRLGPLIVAHAAIDAVSFIGPDVVPQSWLAALGLV